MEAIGTTRSSPHWCGLKAKNASAMLRRTFHMRSDVVALSAT